MIDCWMPYMHICITPTLGYFVYFCINHEQIPRSCRNKCYNCLILVVNPPLLVSWSSTVHVAGQGHVLITVSGQAAVVWTSLPLVFLSLPGFDVRRRDEAEKKQQKKKECQNPGESSRKGRSVRHRDTDKQQNKKKTEDKMKTKT